MSAALTPAVGSDGGTVDVTDQPPTAPASVEPPDLDHIEIDRFQVLSELGSGGMGMVYEAHDPALDRRVAIKLVLRSTSEAEGMRLRREAQSLARLSHPNVVQVFEVGRCSLGVYLVMELVRGRSLRQWLGEATRTRAEILAVFTQAGRGLAAAHAAGMVHRDFKPSNVLVGDDGRTRVVDFGLACTGQPPGSAPDASARAAMSSTDDTSMGVATTAVPSVTRSLGALRPVASPLEPMLLGDDLVSAHLTEPGTIMGTPPYMAPEQHRGHPLAPAADQFAYCVALYQALYGVHPFGPFSGRMVRVLAGQVEAPPSESDVPEPIRAALLRGLARAPADRWPSMEALLRALRPPSRRRFVLAAAAGLVALTALVVVWRPWTPPAAAACTGEPERLAAAWASQRDGARTRVLATELPYAAETWERSEAGLARYERTWLDAYTRTCEAGVQGMLPAEVLDARMRCLDERRGALDALVGALAQADAATVRHAVEAVERLPPTKDCEELEDVRGTLPPPPAALADEVAALRERIATMRALYLTGDHARGLEVARGLRPAVTALDYAPLRAELELREGALLVRAGKPPAARERLEAAYFLAKEAAHDRVELEAALLLVFVVTAQDGDVRDGEVWLGHVEAALERAGTRSQRGSYEAARGVLASQAGRHAEAAEHHARAVELFEAAHGPDSSIVASALANQAGTLAWLGRHDEAIAALRRAIAIDEQQLGPLHPELATHTDNLGMILAHRGDPDAHAVFERALAIRTRILEPDHLDIAVSLANIGSTHALAGRFDLARRALERALELRKRTLGPEHVLVALTIRSLGDLALAEGDAAGAERTYRRAIDTLEQAAPGHLAIAYTEVSLGEALVEQERWAEASELLERGRAGLAAVRGPDHAELLGALQGLAAVALAQGRTEEAVSLGERALAAGERAKLPADRLASARWVLAKVLWETGANGPDIQARALTLAEQAVDAWQEDPTATTRLAEARGWLAERAGG